MEVTYEKILEHYVLKTRDTLCLHGIQYTVKCSTLTSYYYLEEKNRSNALVFERLGIKDKTDYCKGIVGEAPVFGGKFPEIDTLENLTKITKALYERSPYKVGDKVRLKDDIHGCPWVISPMENHAGKVVTIKDITLTHFSGNLNGDPHQYRFKELVGTWSSQTIDHKVDEDTEVTEDTSDKICGPVEKPSIEHGDYFYCGCDCASSSDTDMKSSADCHLVEESIIIQKPKSKIKTTIKL